ncbi:TnsD family Tn7-like transposition protein [Undibacterium sp. WLHG33]|uniref:TnsD family Tn7-like transposition protein n=1 Tax=Undibacterium sp. WLHG33 TaxID=3412482 RepID=UPI003C2FAA97
MSAQLPFFPPSLPDETLYSRVSRYHLMSGNRTDELTFNELFDCKPMALGGVVPFRMEILASRLPGDANDNLAELTQHNTLLPAFRPFLGKPIPSNNGKSQEITHLPRHVVGMNGDAKLCRSCTREDLELYGAPYYHRSHQIPGVSVCWKHRETLVSSCFNCRFPFQHKNKLLSVPWMACRCSELFSSDKDSTVAGQLEHSYAVYSHNLLQENMPPIHPDLLMNTYREKIRQRGFSRGSLINLKDFQDSMIESLGEPFIRSVDPAFSAQRTMSWLRLSYIESALDLPITRHLLLGLHLFGTANRFSTDVHTLVPSNLVSSKQSRTTDADRDTQRNEHRRKIIAELKKNPDLTMEKLWKKKIKVVAWLFEHDRAWLNNTMSPDNKKIASMATSQAQIDEALDLDYARMVEEHSRKLFEQAGKPQKVTIGKMLACLPKTVSASSVSRDRFPQLFATLDLCKESSWCFSARKVLWALGELDRFEETITISHIILRSGVIHSGVEDILRFCDWDAEKLSKSKIDVRHLLAKAGITRTWRGPSDGKLGTRAGRGYVKKYT